MKSTSISFTDKSLEIIRKHRIELGKISPKGGVTNNDTVNSLIEGCEK